LCSNGLYPIHAFSLSSSTQPYQLRHSWPTCSVQSMAP
jgi:hypothetical protein